MADSNFWEKTFFFSSGVPQRLNGSSQRDELGGEYVRKTPGHATLKTACLYVAPKFFQNFFSDVWWKKKFRHFGTKVPIKDFPYECPGYNFHMLWPHPTPIGGRKEFLLIVAEVFYFIFFMKVGSTEKTGICPVGLQWRPNGSRQSLSVMDNNVRTCILLLSVKTVRFYVDSSTSGWPLSEGGVCVENCHFGPI